MCIKHRREKCWHWWQTAITWAVWTRLREASGCSKEICPNNHIWLVVPDHSNTRKIQTKKGLVKLQTFPMERSSPIVSAVWIARASSAGGLLCRSYRPPLSWPFLGPDHTVSEHLVTHFSILPSQENAPVAAIWSQPMCTRFTSFSSSIF